MTRTELVTRIASHFRQLTRQDAEASVSTILSVIANTLAEGRRVEIRGFGAFVVSYRPPRTGRNPASGASVSIPEKNVPHFKPGKELRIRVAASAADAESIAANGQRTGLEVEPRLPA